MRRGGAGKNVEHPTSSCTVTWLVWHQLTHVSTSRAVENETGTNAIASCCVEMKYSNSKRFQMDSHQLSTCSQCSLGN